LNNRDKIKTVAELENIVSGHKRAGRRVTHCHVCFDLLHIGHIRHLQEARQMGDVLVVTVTPDRYVDKGPGRPAFSEEFRAEAISSLDCVDYVAINEWPTAEETLRILRPHVYVKGSDFHGVESDPTGKLAREAAIVQEIGAELAFTKDVVFSSTNLINRFFSTFPGEVKEYLNVFRSRYSIDYVFELLDRMSSLNVLVIGDTIIDDYHYCRTLGVSSKDPALALQYESHDMFAGGVVAVANHVANFANSVRLFTVLGERDSYEEFVRSKLFANVSPYFAIQENALTIIKRRFLEGYSLNKLFEVYIMDDSGLGPEMDRQFTESLREELSNYDLVISADFGHGAISDKARQVLVEHSPFLAVNTQANSGNRGFHTVTRYPRADYVSIAEHEIRLEMRDTNSNILPMMDVIAPRMDCSTFVVTRGKKGCIVRSGEGSFVEVPAFALKVVDRVGAGDAFLSVSAMAAFLGAPPEIVGFMGNVAGAMAVEVVGNQKFIEKQGMKKYIMSIMK